MKKISYLFILILFISCKKEELPISPKLPGDIETGFAPLTSDYRYQLYYNLELNTIVGQNLKTDWDLGFTTGSTDFRIKVNAANAMSVANYGSVSFSDITDTSGFSNLAIHDAVNGNLDSTAIGDWRNQNNVYLINRGFSFTGQHLGYRKIQILDVTPTHYSLRIGGVSDPIGEVYVINKMSDYNFAFFSLNSNEQVMIEPPKNDWDLTFTQYTHIFYQPAPLPYLVTGALQNVHETFALRYDEKPFEEIMLSDVLLLQLSAELNTIGYDWKTFENGGYTIHADQTYIVQDQKGFFYKLRFIDFYDQNGQRGTPTWEYQKL